MTDRDTNEDLDERLARDVDGFQLRLYRERLDARAERCGRVIDAGLRPDDASKVRLVLEAYQAAAQVLPKLWDVHQQNNRRG